MAKSKIIKELVNEEISLSTALKRLIVLANDLEDMGLKNWAEREINGYGSGEEVPEYRKIHSRNFYFTGFNVNLKITEAPLDPRYISEETMNVVECHEVKDPLFSIEKYAKEFTEGFNLDLTMIAPEVYKKSGNRIQCISISQKFNISQLEKILQVISGKVIDILLKLDKEFGCLDDLDIGCDHLSKKKIHEIKHDLQVIINEDKSIHIDGKLKMKNSQIATAEAKVGNKKAQTTNKNSNTGKGNNYVEKHTDVKTEVKFENKEKEQKKGCWLKRLFLRKIK